MAPKRNFSDGPFIVAPETLGHALGDYKESETTKYLNVSSFLDCGNFQGAKSGVSGEGGAVGKQVGSYAAPSMRWRYRDALHVNG
jgi:hypothetical protein